MAKGRWTRETAVSMVKRNGGFVGIATVTPPKPCGIGTWGAIDYLVGKHGYKVVQP